MNLKVKICKFNKLENYEKYKIWHKKSSKKAYEHYIFDYFPRICLDYFQLYELEDKVRLIYSTDFFSILKINSG